MTSGLSRGGLEPGWRIAAWGGAAALLLAPLVAMQFSAEVNWGIEDFVFLGFLLLAACITFELVARQAGGFAYRAASAVAIGGAFLMAVANAAVGFIGDGGHWANLLFFAMIGVGLVMAVAARFRPAGMARALFTMAALQVAILGLILAAGFGAEAPQWPSDVIRGTGFFTVIWVVAGLLYRSAAARGHDERASAS